MQTVKCSCFSFLKRRGRKNKHDDEDPSFETPQRTPSVGHANSKAIPTGTTTEMQDISAESKHSEEQNEAIAADGVFTNSSHQGHTVPTDEGIKNKRTPPTAQPSAHGPKGQDDAVTEEVKRPSKLGTVPVESFPRGGNGQPPVPYSQGYSPQQGTKYPDHLVQQNCINHVKIGSWQNGQGVRESYTPQGALQSGGPGQHVQAWMPCGHASPPNMPFGTQPQATGPCNGMYSEIPKSIGRSPMQSIPHSTQIPAVPTPPPVPTRKALIVGGNYTKTPWEVKNRALDAIHMARRLERNFLFEKENIHVLHDDNSVDEFNHSMLPTKRNIIEQIHWLTMDAKNGDGLFLYLCLQSAPAQISHLESGGGRLKQNLMPYDYNDGAVLTCDDVIGCCLPTGCHMVIFTDGCGGCGFIDLPIKCIVDELETRIEVTDISQSMTGNVIQIAAHRDQRAGSAGNGLFDTSDSATTIFLNSVVQQPGITYKQLMKNLASRVSQGTQPAGNGGEGYANHSMLAQYQRPLLTTNIPMFNIDSEIEFLKCPRDFPLQEQADSRNLADPTPELPVV